MDVFDQSELKRSCEECSFSKVKCSQDRPTCKRCQKHQIACTYAPAKRTGRPRKIRKDTKHPQPRAIRPLASAESRNDNQDQPPIEIISPFLEYNISQGSYAYHQHDLTPDSWFGLGGAGQEARSPDVAHLGIEYHSLGYDWSTNAQDLEALWSTTLAQQPYTDGGFDSSEAELGSYEEDFGFMHAM